MSFSNEPAPDKLACVAGSTYCRRARNNLKLCRHNPTDPTLRSSFLLNPKKRKKKFIWSVQTPGSTCTIKDLLTEAVSDHLNGCYKTTYTGVEAEWKRRLCRVGLFNKASDLPPSRFP